MSTSSLHSHFRWVPSSPEVHIGTGKKSILISKKTPFHVSIEACNLRKHICIPTQALQGPRGAVLGAGRHRPVWPVPVSGAVPRELLRSRSEHVGMQIKITRQEIGRIVGCSREMVGRVLKNLEEQGLVDVSGKTMVVHGTRRAATLPKRTS